MAGLWAPSLLFLLLGLEGSLSSSDQTHSCSWEPSVPRQQLKLILIYPGLLTAPRCWVGILPLNGTLPNPSLATVPPGCPLPPGWLATFCRKRNPSPCTFWWEACPPAHISPLCDAQPQLHSSWRGQLHHHEPPRVTQSPKQHGG